MRSSQRRKLIGGLKGGGESRARYGSPRPKGWKDGTARFVQPHIVRERILVWDNAAKRCLERGRGLKGAAFFCFVFQTFLFALLFFFVFRVCVCVFVFFGFFWSGTCRCSTFFHHVSCLCGVCEKRVYPLRTLVEIYSVLVFRNRCLTGRQAPYRDELVEWLAARPKMEVRCRCRACDNGCTLA